MLAGHFATALVAKQHLPKAPIAYFLVASQLPDMLWGAFHFAGIEHTEPGNPMLASLDTMAVDMTFSHDALPMLGWILLTLVVGRLALGTWRVGFAGAALVLVHTLTDNIAGHPHNVFGPESLSVGTGMYQTAPYAAVGLEFLFTLAVMAWVIRTDRRRGVQRSKGALVAWAAVFGGGLAFMASSADLSMVEVTGLAPLPILDGAMMPMLVLTYGAMIAALIWADRRPIGTSAEPPELQSG